MFNNDAYHEGRHQINAKKRPLILEDAVTNQQMYNFFICVVEKTDFIFQVVPASKKVENG